MTINPTAKKLGIKPGVCALVVGAPPGYLKRLAPLPEGVLVSDLLSGTPQFVQFFATRASEIRKSAPRLLKLAATRDLGGAPGSSQEARARRRRPARTN